jgi:hypothetical protein
MATAKTRIEGVRCTGHLDARPPRLRGNVSGEPSFLVYDWFKLGDAGVNLSKPQGMYFEDGFPLPSPTPSHSNFRAIQNSDILHASSGVVGGKCSLSVSHPREMLWGGGEDIASIVADVNRWSAPCRS